MTTNRKEVNDLIDELRNNQERQYKLSVQTLINAQSRYREWLRSACVIESLMRVTGDKVTRKEYEEFRENKTENNRIHTMLSVQMKENMWNRSLETDREIELLNLLSGKTDEEKEAVRLDTERWHARSRRMQAEMRANPDISCWQHDIW